MFCKIFRTKIRKIPQFLVRSRPRLAPHSLAPIPFGGGRRSCFCRAGSAGSAAPRPADSAAAVRLCPGRAARLRRLCRAPQTPPQPVSSAAARLPAAPSPRVPPFRAPRAAAACLPHERHLVDQVPGAADAVDDQQHVADVDGDVAADRRVEGDVAHRRAPRAVEVDAHQLAAGVEARSEPELPPVVWFEARKADRHRAAAVDFDGPAAVLLRGVQVAQLLRDVVVVNRGLSFSDDAVDGRQRPVVLAVGVFIPGHRAVGHAQREVGVGEGRPPRRAASRGVGFRRRSVHRVRSSARC